MRFPATNRRASLLGAGLLAAIPSAPVSARLEGQAWRVLQAGEMFQGFSFSPEGTPLFSTMLDIQWKGATLPVSRYRRVCNMRSVWTGPDEVYVGSQFGAVRFEHLPGAVLADREEVGRFVTTPDSMPLASPTPWPQASLPSPSAPTARSMPATKRAWSPGRMERGGTWAIRIPLPSRFPEVTWRVRQGVRSA